DNSRYPVPFFLLRRGGADARKEVVHVMLPPTLCGHQVLKPVAVRWSYGFWQHNIHNEFSHFNNSHHRASVVF
ncbi:MAG: hypothetical protein KZQ86_10585, partial [Candidatus Thiodiazotropha sp. (ex Lucinoma kastoroae)]|nr:hypothetical protein [Candidatus Thiodiazotropha sp. (ex Lucinoma kastoroae)]